MSLENYLAKEQEIFKHSIDTFKEEVAAYDLFELVLKEINRSINELPQSGKDKALLIFLMTHVLNTNLRLSFILAMRGHYEAMFATLRPAVEMVSHIYKVSLVPKENSEIWLRGRQRKYRTKYTALFENNIFPDEVPHMKELSRIYGSCCNYGAHSSAYMLVYKTGRVEQDGKLQQYFYDFKVNTDETTQRLIYILHASQHIMGVIDLIYEGLIDRKLYKPVKACVEIFHTQINSLRDKYKEWRKVVDTFLAQNG